MGEPPLSFTFARDQQVVLEATRLFAGPGATLLGLREARRRAGAAVELIELDESDFAARLTATYQRDEQDKSSDDELVFDLEDSGKPVMRDLLEDTSDAPVIQLVNQLLRKTVMARASDLHVETHEGGLRARMRIDGMLHTEFDRKDVPARRVISRLKVMAGLDISETRLPQDGHISVTLGGRVINIRVSTLPGNYGERVVMRVLDRTTGLMPLSDLGLTEAQIAALEQLTSRPNGVVLATGPTGSGKTTTLYSLLKLANSEERNIVTVEDPIEYDLPGISQSQINSEIGMTFAAGLRATLRQDPDIVLVGEIRDTETASTAAQAALTGHLVFSSLHANGSVAAVTRLRDLGLEDYLISATLRGVIAQRLLRRLCPSCRREVAPTEDQRAAFSAAGMTPPAQIAQPGDGCDTCGGIGYSGRVGVFEIVRVNDDLRRAIETGESEQVLEKIALAPGQTLYEQALALAASHETSLAEVFRVVGDLE